jgi:translation initiation factor 3 subunit A
MLEFIDLCVELKDSRKAKDGLYQYRTITQLQQPASLEKLIMYLLDISSKKTADARARADVDLSKEMANLEDLEDEQQSPEVLLMGAVTSDGSRERAEREILVPWVRHMWDTYRNILETLRSVQKLESLYHFVAVKAMNFCKAFSRSAEFKKLWKMLRDHLAVQRKTLADLGEPMSAESVERHLATRFTQLEFCAEMSLWSIAYQTIEDISSIIDTTNINPKVQLMATYYEKLSRIFWVSENYLFHAAAWMRFFTLSVSHNKALSETDRANLASAALLAILAIPIHGATAMSAPASGAGSSSLDGPSSTILEVDVEREKKSRLAALLRSPVIPSRESLLAEATSKGVLKLVRPEVRTLYRLLEVDFGPSTLVASLAPIFSSLRAEVSATVASSSLHAPTTAVSPGGVNALCQYVPFLERLAVFRLLEQLSSVYDVVKIKTFVSLISGLSFSLPHAEKLIVRAVKARHVAIRFDHKSGVILLGNTNNTNTSSLVALSGGLEVSVLRKQLLDLAMRLQSVVNSIAPASGSKAMATDDAQATISAAGSSLRERIFEAAKSGLAEAQEHAWKRREVIEIRKEEDERKRKADEKAVSSYKSLLRFVWYYYFDTSNGKSRK